MKKLFYSFVMLVAMSLSFVACGPQVEPEPEVKSNCTVTSVQTKATEFGQVYVVEATTNDVALTNSGFSGTGDYFYMQMYATPQED